MATPPVPAVTLSLPDAAEAPHFEPMSWQTIEEGLDEENFTDKIVEHVQTGASMCVLGGAGTGKSVCLRRVRSALQEQGLQVACVSLTHCAARNVDGVTCHSFVQKYVSNGVFAGHVVLIDEISFLSVDLLAQLEQLRLKGTRLLAFGDFKQPPPVSNRWRGQVAPP